MALCERGTCPTHDTGYVKPSTHWRPGVFKTACRNSLYSEDTGRKFPVALYVKIMTEHRGCNSTQNSNLFFYMLSQLDPSSRRLPAT